MAEAAVHYRHCGDVEAEQNIIRVDLIQLVLVRHYEVVDPVVELREILVIELDVLQVLRRSLSLELAVVALLLLLVLQQHEARVHEDTTSMATKYL